LVKERIKKPAESWWFYCCLWNIKHIVLVTV